MTLQPCGQPLTRRCAVRSMALISLAASAAALGGCALFRTPPEPDVRGSHYSGRIAVRVENSAQRSFSAAFDLAGTDIEGVLSLSTPIGVQLARAVWSPQRVELQSPQRNRTYPTLDALATDTLGESVPIAALFDWLAGRPWRNAASRPRPGGFEQLGWQVDTSGLVDGTIIATRPSAPVVVVRVRLDRP